VSLGWSGNEEDDVSPASVAGPSGLFGRYETNLVLSNETNDSTAPEDVYNSSVVASEYICHTLSAPSETEAVWMLDSGASRHFTFDINDFVEYEATESIPLRTATSFTTIVGKGTVILYINEKAVRLSPLYHVPDISHRLLSLGQFLKSRLFSRGSAREISLYEEDVEFLTFHPRTEDDSIYVIRTLLEAQLTAAKIETIYSADFGIMHRRLAHPSKEVIQKAGKHVKDFPHVEIPKEHLCTGCAQGKMTNKAFPPSSTRATAPFELIHSDLKTFPIESYRKYKYSIVFYDDYTSHAWTMNLHTKDGALMATRHFLAMVETRYQKKVRRWMSDAGGEYMSLTFTTMLKEKGIEILQSIPHAHQQNGRAERIIRTLMDKEETMRLQACLPQSWWEFALDHATDIYNRTPNRRLNWQTPFQLLNGSKPSIDHLRVLGCGAYVFIPEEVRINKLAPRSELMTYLGTHPGGKGWIFMRGPNNIIFSAAQATFDELHFPKCPTASVRRNTRLQSTAPPLPSHHCHKDSDCQCPLPGGQEGDDAAPSARHKPTPKPSSKGKERAIEPAPWPQTPVQFRAPSLEPPRSPTPSSSSNSDPEDASPAPPTIMPPSPVKGRRPQHERKVPAKPGNVYGSKHPVEIIKSTRRMKDWKKVVGDFSVAPVEQVGYNTILLHGYSKSYLKGREL
jgi:hypothetical protein